MDKNEIKKAYVQWIPIEQVELNEGQIEGVPSNPRKIIDEDKEKLTNSIKEDPEYMLYNPCQVYPLNGKYVVISGNQRTTVCRELDWKELPCVVFRADTPVEVLRSRVIKPNTQFGYFDWLALEEWDAEKLNNWGVDNGFMLDTSDLLSSIERDGASGEQTNPTGMFQVTFLFDNEYADLIKPIMKSSKAEVTEKIIEICRNLEAN